MESPIAPTPPPRSKLRLAAPPRAIIDPLPRPSVSEKLASLYELPVAQPPPPATPSLTSASSDDGHADVSPESPAASGSKRLSQPSEGLVSWGRRRKSGIERDEYKVRDGAVKRKASSGVYTPPTFPGPAGPRPSHFPTHVYTPKTFVLYPTVPCSTTTSQQTARAVSISSTDSSPSDNDWPRTPVTPVTPASASGSQTRFSVNLAGASKSVSTFTRRISNQISSLDLRGSSSGQGSLSPPIFSARDSYFPASPSEIETTLPTHSRQSSYGVVIPTINCGSSNYVQSSRGLGIGLVERDGQTAAPSIPLRHRSQTIAGMSPLVESEVNENSLRREKGLKRKPVPRLPDEDELVDGMKGLEVDEVGHAL